MPQVDKNCCTCTIITLNSCIGGNEVAREECQYLGYPTIRHIKCSIFLTSSNCKRRCLNCEKHRKTLQALASKQLKHQHVDKTAPESHVNYRFLSPSEKTDRLKRLHSQQRCDLLKADRLKKKLAKAIEVCGMTVDDGMHSDLKSMMEDSSATIGKKFF